MQQPTPRVRFAPSPTGALHIGGIRTALYNYLLAKQQGGTFILRIEDTDQSRYVPGAENYIMEALEWCGLLPDESPSIGGPHAPYRQSERKALYREYALKLVESGKAYYAFDTPDALDALRNELKEEGANQAQYDARTRSRMSNSLTLSAEEVAHKIEAGEPYVIRLKVDPGQTILINDMIRGEVRVQSDELDDKVMLKSDGMPTYHLANVVDDFLMKITHVIRGEEWLPSTPHHVLLYQSFGWSEVMPQFAHLPLILKPDGKGKLSKRDGAKFGIPVFPLGWNGNNAEESFIGFREYGFDPKAVINFLALLGWSTGDDREVLSMEEMIEEFDIERIHKAGARFDFEKARWFNQQYLLATDEQALASQLQRLAESRGLTRSLQYLEQVVRLMKERVHFLPEIFEKGSFFFGDVTNYDQAALSKKWKPEMGPVLHSLTQELLALAEWNHSNTHDHTQSFMAAQTLKPGDVLPLLRLALAGTLQGPGVFEMMEVLGKEESLKRIQNAVSSWSS